MKNPLSDKYSEKDNLLLVDKVLEGDSKALLSNDYVTKEELQRLITQQNKANEH